jgi:protein SCO1
LIHQNSRRTLLVAAAAWLASFASGSAAAPGQAAPNAPSIPAALPRNSVYQLDVTLTDQDGQAIRWRDTPAQHTGPRIVGMFYSYCDMVCPMLFETVKIIEGRLPEAARSRLRVDMISFDPARDDILTLKKTAAQRAGDERRWRLYRPQPADVRKVAGVLGVQYRRLASGEFNHSTPMILLDAQGVELMRSETIGKPDPAFVKAVEKSLST